MNIFKQMPYCVSLRNLAHAMIFSPANMNTDS